MKNIKIFFILVALGCYDQIDGSSSSSLPPSFSGQTTISGKSYDQLSSGEIDAAYNLFGLTPNTNYDKAEVTKIYKNKASLTHPDKPAGSAAAFSDVQNAFSIIKKDQERKKYWGSSVRANTSSSSSSSSAASDRLEIERDYFDPNSSVDDKLRYFLSYPAGIKIPQDVYLEKDIEGLGTDILRIGVKGEWIQEALQNLIKRGVKEQDYEFAIDRLIDSIHLHMQEPENMKKPFNQRKFKYLFTGPQFRAEDFISGVLEGLDYDVNDPIGDKLKRLLKFRLFSDFSLFNQDEDEIILAKKGQTVQEALESLSRNSDFQAHPWLNNRKARGDLYSEFYHFLYDDMLYNNPHGFLEKPQPGSDMGLLNKKRVSYFFPRLYYGFPDEPQPDWDKFIQSKYLKQVANNIAYNNSPLFGFTLSDAGKVEKIIDILDVAKRFGQRSRHVAIVGNVDRVGKIIDVLELIK